MNAKVVSDAQTTVQLQTQTTLITTPNNTNTTKYTEETKTDLLMVDTTTVSAATSKTRVKVTTTKTRTQTNTTSTVCNSSSTTTKITTITTIVNRECTTNRTRPDTRSGKLIGIKKRSVSTMIRGRRQPMMSTLNSRMSWPRLRKSSWEGCPSQTHRSWSLRFVNLSSSIRLVR